MKRPRAAVALLSLALSSIALPAGAHPGRLDVSGCHHVRASGGYTYKDGTHRPEGDYHCHRPLGQMRLDGRERLRAPEEVESSEPDRKRDENEPHSRQDRPRE